MYVLKHQFSSFQDGKEIVFDSTNPLFNLKLLKIMKHPILQSCIDACFECAAACEQCAMICLKKNEISPFVRCIQTSLSCASICTTTARVVFLDPDQASKVCEVCAELCETCAAECERIDHHHCSNTAQLARDCAEACRKMIGQLVYSK